MQDVIERMAVAKKDRRQADWQFIKASAPDVAELLTEFNKEFGKPAAMRIELVGGVVIESGTFAGGVSRLGMSNGKR